MCEILGFFGGDTQVGVTMIAQSVAEQLAEQGDQVLLVCGSGNSGEDFMELTEKHSLDDLKAGIISGRVSGEDLLQSLEKTRGLWVLPSVRNPLTAKYFPANTYQILLEALDARFRYVVIDGGADANLGLTMSALHTCRHRFFVITQQSKAVRRYAFLRQQVLDPLQITGTLVVNQYQRDPSLLRQRELLPLCGAVSAITVPYVEYGWQAEMERRTLRRYPRFRRGIEQITASLTAPAERRHPWRGRKHFVWKNT